jgi:hypothetical protein
VRRDTLSTCHKAKLVLSGALVCVGVACGCGTVGPSTLDCTGFETREEAIPFDAVKQTPATDLYPPVVHSFDFSNPEPLPGLVNTPGSEDAPVISRDGNTLFFFFTPDSSVPADEQLYDCVSGVWWCQRSGRSWTDPERCWLSDNLALDGPLCEQDGTLWFASYRAGGYKDVDVYTATWDGLSWSWGNAGAQLNGDYQIGEVYLTATGDTMVYQRDSSFGIYGAYDLWESYRDGNEWTLPVNLGPDVNSSTYDGWPYLSPNGNELWFTRFVSEGGYQGPAIYRCYRTAQGWSTPEEVVSNYVGDPGMDRDGNLYFTHHFVNEGGQTIETDIYVCYRW